MMWVERLRSREPLLWINPQWRPAAQALPLLPLSQTDIAAAEARLSRWAPLIAELFPQTRPTHGLIESQLRPVATLPGLAAGVGGQFFVKCDHDLPVAGSIKARGGLYEVCRHAERLAVQHGVWAEGEPSEVLASPHAKALFAGHEVVVGSTGNLGLSIGIAAAALGFHAIVHMSADAKEWKKARLRAFGVEVMEHSGDFSDAVAAGRQQARERPTTYFVDDESSRELFLGYSVAAARQQKQLTDSGVTVDAGHPLLVYLPCGVGGAPGGITFGLRHAFGDHAHCLFVEPVASPCMLVRLGMHAAASVYDVGLDNKTDADGLAVARASELAAVLVRSLVSGIFTVQDETLFVDLAWAHDELAMRVEPSATAGLRGPAWILGSDAGKAYLERHQLLHRVEDATHVAWTTGGLFVPPQEYATFYERGRRAA